MSSVSISKFERDNFLDRNKCIPFRGEHISGFHRDAILCDFVIKLLENYHVFVETGTYLGITASFVSSNCPAAKIYSCELSKSNFEVASAQCQGLDNVEIQNIDSWNFLAKIDDLVSRDLVPVFWLDAHSDSDNDTTFFREIDLIKSKYERYVILIDDVKNPNFPSSKAQIYDPAIIGQLKQHGARWPKYSGTYRFQNQNLDLDSDISCSGWCLITTEEISCSIFDEWNVL